MTAGAGTRAGESHATPEDAARYWEARARRYQEVHDGSPDGMMIFRAVRDAVDQIVDFEWIYCNPSASKIVGRDADELLGKRLLVEMPGNKAAGLFDIYVRVVELGEPYSHEFAYHHEGLDKWFRNTAIKLEDGFYVAFSDLTVRRRAEEQVARLAAIVRSSEHAIYSTSTSNVVETWNKGAERLFGYDDGEMVGRSIVSTVPERYRVEHDDAVRRVLGREGARASVESFQTVRLTKAGTTVHVSLTLSPISDPGGTAVGVAAIARDISEQVQLQERVELADRMASVSTLATGMAHEINNPLSSVVGNLDVVIEELRVMGGGSPSGRLEELEAMARDAREGAGRIGQIVHGLSMALHEIRARARVVKDYGPVPRVFADEARLGQVFLNLLVNAGQAIGAGAADANEIRIVTSTDETGRAVVEVRDTGPGISAEILARLFDPFFTTKAIGVGAGLGLSICRNIVTGMGGEITVKNNDGRGATFCVVLPPAIAPSVEAPETRNDDRAPSGRGTVLVIDDEPSVGIVLARVLREHDVTVTTRAKEALGLLIAGKRFDAILSDVMMPEMSGMEFYRELARQLPEAAERVVFMTGGVFTPVAREFLDSVTNERVTKPFETKSLRLLVKRFMRT